MNQGLFSGDTDYSHQSFNDLIDDINNWIENINTTQVYFKKTIKQLNNSKYLKKQVPSDYKILISKSIKMFKTSIQELNEIEQELKKEVRLDHVKRLHSLGVTAHKTSNYYGKIWNQQYPNKEYNNKNFKLVENLYSKGRDTLNNMIDLINLSERLKDFVGKKSKNTKISLSRIAALSTIIMLIITLLTFFDYNKLFEENQNPQTFGNNSHILQDVEVATFNYQNTKDPNYLNERNNEILGLNAIEIVKNYFNSQNSNNFSLACSLST